MAPTSRKLNHLPTQNIMRVTNRPAHESIPSHSPKVRTNTTVPIRLFIVDGHEVARIGVRTMLDPDRQITVVGEAGTIDGAVEAMRQLTPDVVLLELRLPDGSGLDACRLFQELSPHTAVLIWTYRADDESLVAALRAGTMGFVLKTIAGEDFIRTIKTVTNGYLVFDGAIAQRMLPPLRRPSVATHEK